jgi:hypothetical protein
MQVDEAGDAAFGAARADHRVAFGEAAAQDAPDRQLAAMRRMQRFHHLRQRRAAVGHAQASPRLGEGRRFVPQRLEQARHAVAAIGRTDQHRDHVTLAQLARQIVEDAVARRLDVGEEFLHQLVVVIG